MLVIKRNKGDKNRNNNRDNDNPGVRLWEGR